MLEYLIRYYDKIKNRNKINQNTIINIVYNNKNKNNKASFFLKENETVFDWTI